MGDIPIWWANRGSNYNSVLNSVTLPMGVTFWKGSQNDAVSGCKEVSVPRYPFSEF